MTKKAPFGPVSDLHGYAHAPDHPDAHPLCCVDVLPRVPLDQHGHARDDRRRAGCLLPLARSDPSERGGRFVRLFDALQPRHGDMFRHPARLAIGNLPRRHHFRDVGEGAGTTGVTLCCFRSRGIARVNAEPIRDGRHLRGRSHRCGARVPRRSSAAEFNRCAIGDFRGGCAGGVRRQMLSSGWRRARRHRTCHVGGAIAAPAGAGGRHSDGVGLRQRGDAFRPATAIGEVQSHRGLFDVRVRGMEFVLADCCDQDIPRRRRSCGDRPRHCRPVCWWSSVA